MDWATLEKDIIELYPFLAKIGFGFKDETNHFPLPSLLTISSFAAINITYNDSETRRLAIIFPHSESIACHIATIASLAAIKKQSERGFPPLPDLISGDIVLLDGVEYAYQGEEIHKIPVFVLKSKTAVRMVPATSANRLRMQHSVSSRNLTKRDKEETKSIIDSVLSLKLRGNTSLFQTSIILISGVSETKERVSKLCLSDKNDVRSKLSNVFAWGSLTEEKETKIWGSAGRREEPIVLVSSNFADVEEHLEYNSRKIDLIIVDGDSYVKDVTSFESLLSRDIPVVFIFSGKHQDGIQLLKKRDFTFWAWNAKELIYLQDSLETEESPFFELQDKIASFASFDIKIIECFNSAFAQLFNLLNNLRRKVSEEDYHATQILGRIFTVFIRISRLVSVSNLTIQRTEKEIALIEDDLRVFRFNLKSDFLESFIESIELLKQGSALLTDRNSKPAKLIDEIKSLISNGYEKICVVLSKSDYQSEREYLLTRLPSNKVFFERNASFKMRDNYDCVILCGYLKRNHMLRIFDEALATELKILNYSHEQEWTNSVERQFFGAFNKQDFRNAIVFGKRLLANTPFFVASRETQKKPVLEEFEIHLNEFKRQRILKSLAEDTGGLKVTARCVTFNQGSFAFLTESYSVPVINELLSGKAKVEKIPQKRIKDILPGDFLLFRESSGRNLIREVADLGLDKGGKKELRKVASAWREALRNIYEHNNKSLSKVKNELKKYECDRNELTIKNWLFDENQIAPGEDSDILAIAAAADDNKLIRNYDEVVGAISQIRGAHIQAARQVAKLLEKRVKGNLHELSDTDVEIKIPGLGKVFVVCVESIDFLSVEVASHRTNRLLKEKEIDNGANDSTIPLG